jgi:hypothetical protein
MKKLVLLSIGMLALALQPAANAQPVTSLFTTYDDFTNFTAGWGAAPVADSAFSTDNNTVNGVGNPTAPGGVGVNGSLDIPAVSYGTNNSVWTDIATAPSLSGFNAINAIDPGYQNDNNAVLAAGNFYIDYSLPDNEGGSYFSMGVLLQYAGNGYWGTYFQSSSTDLGFTDSNGLEVYRATIPYTISGGNIYGYGFGVMLSSDYKSVLGFTIDNISVSATPEPGTIALIGMGLTGLMFIRRRQS